MALVPRRIPVSTPLLLAILTVASAATAVLCWHAWQTPVFTKRVIIQSGRIKAANGKAFKITLPRQQSMSDKVIARSDLLENGTPLKPAGSINDIEQNGNGVFRIKSSGIWFATSDNSSPLTNGRRYEVRTIWEPPALLLPLSCGVLGLALALLAIRPAASGRSMVVLGVTRVLGWISIPDASMDATPFSPNAPDPDRS